MRITSHESDCLTDDLEEDVNVEEEMTGNEGDINSFFNMMRQKANSDVNVEIKTPQSVLDE